MIVIVAFCVLINFSFLACTVAANSNNSELKHDGEVMQIQTSGNRRSSISSRRNSTSSKVGSRSSSPSPHSSVTIMDPTRFSLSTDMMADKLRKKFTKENFTSKAKGMSLELTQEKPDDPLSQLDPLWPLKRL